MQTCQAESAAVLEHLNPNLFTHHLNRCSSILGWRFGQYHLEEFRFEWEQWFIWNQEKLVPAAGGPQQHHTSNLCVIIPYLFSFHVINSLFFMSRRIFFDVMSKI